MLNNIFSDTYSTDCYILDLAVSPKKWVAIADMPGIKYLFGMAYVEAVDKMYVIGGNSMQVYVYSNTTKGWYTSRKFQLAFLLTFFEGLFAEHLDVFLVFRINFDILRRAIIFHKCYTSSN